MPSRLRAKLSYANVTATLALFLALGGTGYAVAKIRGSDVVDGSLTGRDLASNSVRGADISGIRSGDIVNGTVQLRDIDSDARAGLRGQKGDKGDKGDPGSRGEAGPKGDPGTTLLWAAIGSDGAIARQSGLTTSQRLSSGDYVLTWNRAITGCAYLGTVGETGSIDPTPGYPIISQRLNDDHQIYVQTMKSDGAEDGDRDFYVAVLC